MNPIQTLDRFFRTLMQSQCHVCFDMMSSETQKASLDWIVAYLYLKQPRAAQAAELGPPEAKLMVESNDTMLMKSFWRQFYITSRTYDYVYFGKFEMAEENGGHAIIQVNFQYPNGNKASRQVHMAKQRGAWRLAYIESKLPWPPTPGAPKQ